MSTERIQKILARAGVASRRHAEELITAGRVTVNGQVAGLGDRADPATDAVKVDGKRIEPRRAGTYLLLNKPRAVMSTSADPEGRPTVIELVPPALRKALVPVGRLDFLTEGLIILTDDGELAQRVAHPRYGCGKTYEVKVRGEPTATELERLRDGIVLEGRRTAPAKIVRRRIAGPSARRFTRGGDDSDGGNSWWTVQLSEGRSRQIREMFARVGHQVMKLRRVAIGPVTDRHLPLGAVRELTEREVESLRHATEPGAAGKAAKSSGPARSRAGWAKAKPKSTSGGRLRGKRVTGDDARPEGKRGGGTATKKARPAGKGDRQTGRGGRPAGKSSKPARKDGGPSKRGGSPAKEAGGAARKTGGPARKAGGPARRTGGTARKSGRTGSGRGSVGPGGGRRPAGGGGRGGRGGQGGRSGGRRS